MSSKFLFQYRNCFRVLDQQPPSLVKYIESWFGDTMRTLQMFYTCYITGLLSEVLANTTRITKDNVWEVYKSLQAIDPRHPTPQDVVATPIMVWLRGLRLEMPEYAKRSYVEAAMGMTAWRGTFGEDITAHPVGKILPVVSTGVDNTWLFLATLEHYYRMGNGLGYLLLRLNLTTADQTTINNLNLLIKDLRAVNWDLEKGFAILVKANKGFLHYGLDTLPEFAKMKVKREKRQRLFTQFKAGCGSIAVILALDTVVRFIGC